MILYHQGAYILDLSKAARACRDRISPREPLGLEPSLSKGFIRVAPTIDVVYSLTARTRVSFFWPSAKAGDIGRGCLLKEFEEDLPPENVEE